MENGEKLFACKAFSLLNFFFTLFCVLLGKFYLQNSYAENTETIVILSKILFDRLIANDEKKNISEQETFSEKQIAVLLKLTGNIIKSFRSNKVNRILQFLYILNMTLDLSFHIKNTGRASKIWIYCYS